MRPLLVSLLAIAALGLVCRPASGQTPPGDLPDFGIEFHWPHDGPLLELFDSGDSPYGPQHTGIDIAAVAGQPVRAVADGVVTFAGTVVSNTWVTIEHQPELLSTVGSMETLSVAAGDVVTKGQVLGTTSGVVHGDVAGIHLGFRWQGSYVDPLQLLPPRRPRAPSLLGTGGWVADDTPTATATTASPDTGTRDRAAELTRSGQLLALASVSGVGFLPSGELHEPAPRPA